MGTKQRLILAITVSALLMGGAAAAGADDHEEPTPPGANIEQVSSIEPAAIDAMSAFDGGRTVTDDMPGAIAERLDRRPLFGMNPSLSRLVVGNASNSLYLIPANDHVCAALTVGDGANYSCRTISTIAGGQAGAATVLLETGDIGVYGMVPDGVASVALNIGVSDTAAVAVADNAYYAVVQAGTALRTIAYSGPAGAVEFPIYDPSQGREVEQD
jgi:hypothetical protein